MSNILHSVLHRIDQEGQKGTLKTFLNSENIFFKKDNNKLLFKDFKINYYIELIIEIKVIHLYFLYRLMLILQ